MNDLDRLFQDISTSKRSIHRTGRPKKRCFFSNRLERFTQKLSLYIDSLNQGQKNGPMSISDRISLSMVENYQGRVRGDEILNDIMRTLNEFSNGVTKFVPRPNQRQLVYQIIGSCIPFIYGEDLTAAKRRILKLLKIKELREQLLILAPRRVGKTTCIAWVCGTLMICVPFIDIASISVAKRASKRVMDASVYFLNMNSRGRALLNKTNTIKNQEELKLFGLNATDIKTLLSLPANGDVCYYFFHFYFFLLYFPCFFF